MAACKTKRNHHHHQHQHQQHNGNSATAKQHSATATAAAAAAPTDKAARETTRLVKSEWSQARIRCMKVGISDMRVLYVYLMKATIPTIY